MKVGHKAPGSDSRDINKVQLEDSVSCFFSSIMAGTVTKIGNRERVDFGEQDKVHSS